MGFYRQAGLFFLFLIAGLAIAPASFARGYEVAAVPGWVAPVPVPTGGETDARNHSNGVAYLLVDDQWRVDAERQVLYRHFANRALNSEGVTEISQISIDFDPLYQSLTLHRLSVQRDGHNYDRLDRSQISLIQREKDLEYQIYDGSKTLNIFIEDVRPGDIVEYSFSIDGANPAFSGHFAQQLEMGWEVPVARIHYRLLWRSSRPLQVKKHAIDIEPVTRTAGGQTEYVWNREGVAELPIDQDVPNWYDPLPSVYLSDMASWSEVSAWAWPYYRPVTDTPLLRELAAKIDQTADTAEGKVLAALHFVQEEVRYLGIEMGTGSHRPNTPDAVIRQRFGDCKDKSRLLVSLLQSLGIEASPALVNSSYGEGIVDELPTPAAFDHVIVRVLFDGKNYWLDPTRTHQEGRLDTIYQPDYHYALVISEQHPGLTKISADIKAVHVKVVEEDFDISDAVDNPASYRIRTSQQGYFADSLREDLSATSLSQLQQTFLNYTAHYFPDVQVAKEVEVADDNIRNQVTLTEEYAIPQVWHPSDDGRYLLADFEPFLINDQISTVTAPVRSMPYAVTHPVEYRQTTRIRMPANSVFDDEFEQVEDPAFLFSKREHFANNVLTISYRYQSLSDHVDPEHIQAYAKNINKLINLARFQVQMPNPAFNSVSSAAPGGDINWPMALVTLLTLVGAVLLSHRYVYRYDPPCRPSGLANPGPAGLGGWLILPGLGLIASPFRILWESRDLWFVFSARQWAQVAEQFGSTLSLVIMVELLCNLFLIIFSLFLILMFFTRRHTFPRLFITFLLLSLTLFGTDLLMVHLLSPPGIKVTAADIGQLARQGIFALIWTLYFLRSKRVKATFIRQRRSGKGETLAASAEAEAIVPDGADG